MINDKIPVVIAIMLLAFFATYAAKMIQELEVVKELLAFFTILASGLFGLVTGMTIERVRNKLSPFQADKKKETP